MDRVHREELHALRSDSLSRAAVLLVGHGSLLDPDSSRPVHKLASHLRDCGRFGEVRTAFWKEEPQLHYAFDLIEHPEVFVVPVFMSEGYFTDRVVPRDLGLDGRVTCRGPWRIQYCDPVGSHPRMSEIVSARADELVPAADRASTTVVILGHGTNEHPQSARTTLNMVKKLRNEDRYARVLPAFLDQDPTLNRILETERTGPMAVIPFFVSEGWHVGTTIPKDIALEGGEHGPAGPPIWFSRPVGTHPTMAEVVLDLVGCDSDTAADQEPDTPCETSSFREGGLPAVEARKEFLSWIRAAAPGYRVFLQAAVRCSGQDRFEIRHEKDRDAATTALRSLSNLDQVRDVARRTATGEYRPLSTAPNLQKGWRLADLTADEVWEAFDRLYPAAPVHWQLKSIGRLDVVSFREAADCQTGLYAGTADLDDDHVEALAQACCAPERCLREPTWAVQISGRSSASKLWAGQDIVVPCPAPCSVFFSIATHAVDELPPSASTLDPPWGSR